MTKPMYDTPMLDQLEGGPWPSFVTGLKHLAETSDMMVDLLGQLETSYETRKGYWKGGTVGVMGYGGGIIPRFTELKDENNKPVFPAAAEFHTLRVIPPPGMHYDTKTIRHFCDIWEKYGSGLIAFHGQSGDIMFQGCTTENVQKAFDEMKEADAEIWATDCPLAAIQFQQHAGVKPMHPMSVLARAYREDGFDVPKALASGDQHEGETK